MYNDDQNNPLADDSRNQNSGLGKGLESLIPSQNSAPSSLPSEPVSAPTTPYVPPAIEEAEPPDEKKDWAWEAAKKNQEKLEASRMADAIFHVEVDKVFPNPDQPRRNFNVELLKELAASIREFGLLQPIVVSKIEHEVAGGDPAGEQTVRRGRR